jgi:hypothetical protein
MFIAASTVVALRSGSFVSAISLSWSSVIDARTFWGVPEPFPMPAAFAISLDAGGVLSTNVKVRSCKHSVLARRARGAGTSAVSSAHASRRPQRKHEGMWDTALQPEAC